MNREQLMAHIKMMKNAEAIAKGKAKVAMSEQQSLNNSKCQSIWLCNLKYQQYHSLVDVILNLLILISDI